jgi:hypothetical protein
MNLSEKLRTSDETLLWIQASLNGLKIQRLPSEKRIQLSAACWHVGIEHGQAIVVLIHKKLFGSALALERPLAEAYVRGLWLHDAASDQQVDDAGRDRFPNDLFGQIVGGLEKAVGESVPIFSSEVFRDFWKQMCSQTHTGWKQIGARLTPNGLDSDYPESQLIAALWWADSIALLSAVALAQLAGRADVAEQAQVRFVTVTKVELPREDDAARSLTVPFDVGS